MTTPLPDSSETGTYEETRPRSEILHSALASQTGHSRGWAFAPYAMIRFNPVSGGQVGTHHHRRLNQVREIRHARGQLKQTALDDLYRLAADVSDDLRHRVVLPTSRAVFKDRLPRIPAAALAELGSRCPGFGRWLGLVKEELVQQQGLEQAVAAAMEADRLRLQAIIGSADFLLAASVTSPDMARGAIRYATTPLAEHNKRIRKSEPKLCRYAERAATKTSPFSHFTVVAAAEWSEDSTPASDTAERVSRVESNLLLIVRLLDAAMNHPGLAAVATFHRCEGLRVTDSGYEFEVMRDDPGRSRVYRAQRAKVSIKHSTPIELVLTVLERSGGSATLTDLSHALAEHSAQPLSALTTQGYVHKLRAAGLLVPTLQVDQHAAEPALNLAHALDRLSGDPAHLLSDQLKALHQATGTVIMMSGTRRADAIDCLRAQWKEAFTVWGAESLINSPLYEDVSLRQSVGIRTSRWERVRTDLAELLPALEPLNMDHPGQVLMRLMMVDHFGQGGRCSYQDFVALLPSVFTAERLSLAAILAEVGDRDSDLTRLLKLREGYLEAIAAGVGTHEVVLDDELIHRLADETPKKFRRGYASVSAFLQPVSETSGVLDTVVLNAVLDGNGQFLSRFLGLWDGGWTERIRAHLRETLPAGATELRPVQGFNANVHPPMLDMQFAMQELVGMSETPLVDTSDLVIVHDPASDKLVLEDAAGQPVHPRYLGFLVPYLLPWELTGLYLLSEPSQLRIDAANELERQVPETDEPRVRRYPRVRFRSVLLARERWYIPRELVPVQNPDETMALFLVRLDDWRAANSIPQRVFMVRLNDSAAADRDSLGRPKPMYVDLRSPLHMRSMPTWLGQAETIRIDEALPDPADPLLTDPNFGACVTEYLLESYQAHAQTEKRQQ